MFQTSAFGHTYATAGPADVGVRIYDATVQAVSFARKVELQKLGMEKRRLEMQEAQMAANREASQRNFNLAEERFALERQRLDIDDADRQQKREMALAQFQQTMAERAEARDLREREFQARQQEAQKKQEFDQANRQAQLDMQRQRQESIDNYRASRLELMREQQRTRGQADSPSGKGATASVNAYNTAMDDWIKNLEADKASRQAWIATEAKKARSLADRGGDDAEDMARRADTLERWDTMDDTERIRAGRRPLYDEVQANTWSDKQEKVLDFAKTLRTFAKLHPEIYRNYGLSPLALASLPWAEADEDEMDMAKKLMEQRDVSEDDIKFIVNTILGRR